MMRKVKKAFNSLVNIFLVFSIIIAVHTMYSSICSNDPVFILGYKPVRILTGSMEPTLSVGSIVIIKKIPPEEIQVGDIIMYDFNNSLVTHRVVDKDETSFQTKGDNNNIQDPYRISYDDVQGVAKVSFPQKIIIAALVFITSAAIIISLRRSR